MHLRGLEVVDFRSWATARLGLRPGATALIGANGEGKTNLLEAVHYLATGGSHRVSSDAPLVRAGADSAVLRADVAVDGREVRLELELRTGRRRARIDGQSPTATRQVFEVLRCVLFSPEDVALVRGEPADRRRFLDELLGQRRSAYRGLRQDYERVVRQRTAVLRELRAGRGGSGLGVTLEAWTEQLVHLGSAVLAARIAAVHALAGPFADSYRELLHEPGHEPGHERGAAAGPTLSYQLSGGRAVEGRPGGSMPDPAGLALELRETLRQLADGERDRGLTLAGPHRDELVLTVDGLPAKSHASQGEVWSLALALRLASRSVLADIGAEPVVLLDDVFAALDEDRRRRLAARCSQFEQVLLTATAGTELPLPVRVVQVGAGMLVEQEMPT